MSAQVIYPAPAGVFAASQPTPAGAIWLLSKSAGATTATEMDLLDGSLPVRFPVGSDAMAIAQVVDGPIVISSSSASAGSIATYDPGTHRPIASWPVSGPVVTLSAGVDVIDAVVQTGSSMVLDEFSPSGDIERNVPVPGDTVGIVQGAQQGSVHLLESDGVLSTIQPDGSIVTIFRVGPNARALAPDPTRPLIFVLKGVATVSNVSIIDTQTQQTLGVLPAPANCVAVAVDPGGSWIFDVAGTADYGNVQRFAIPGA